jgi:hypothetical protein
VTNADEWAKILMIRLDFIPVEKTPAKIKELAIKNVNLSNKRPWRGTGI